MMNAMAAMARHQSAPAMTVPAVLTTEIWDRPRPGLWTASGTAILLLHGALLAAGLLWQAHFPPPAPPPAAMMIELAPLPTSPQVPPSEKAPGLEQTISRPMEKPAEEAPKPPPVVKKAEVALPKPKPVMRQKPVEAPVAEKVVEQTSAPQTTEAPPAPTMAAPSQGAASTLPPSNAVPTWKGVLLAHLERYKRYPRAAQIRHQQGVVTVRFVMARDGRVLSARLEKGAGYSSLDEEGVALLERAQPLPPPPDDVAGERIELVVPIQFFVK